jgi:hypothetical protein
VFLKSSVLGQRFLEILMKDIDEDFYSEKIVDIAFEIYEDMHKLQQWVHEMSLTHKE